MYHIVISEIAEAEYNSAYWYYEEKQTGLGASFEQQADAVLKSIRRNPFIFQRKYRQYREALLRKSPYLIVYEIIRENIIVHSFFHTSQNPNKKYKRVK